MGELLDFYAREEQILIALAWQKNCFHLLWLKLIPRKIEIPRRYKILFETNLGYQSGDQMGSLDIKKIRDKMQVFLQDAGRPHHGHF